MNKLDGIFVYDIDDLQDAVSSHVEDRKKEADRAESIIEVEVERFQARLQTLHVVPTIVSCKTSSKPSARRNWIACAAVWENSRPSRKRPSRP